MLTRTTRDEQEKLFTPHRYIRDITIGYEPSVSLNFAI
jgi:hypothetical protein